MQTMTRFRRVLPAAVAALLLVGCETLNVPDFNNGDLNDLQQNPTVGAVITGTQGLFFGTRQDIANRNDYVVLLGILGREGYNFDAADPRFVTEMLLGPLDGGSPAFGGNLWTNPYANIRNGNIVLGALDELAGLSAGEIEGLRGIAKTIQALDFLIVITTRDDLGAPLDVGGDPRNLAEVATRAETFTHIAGLLDEADAHLTSADVVFPQALAFPSGFSNFSTPGTFRQFNRALRARVAVYQEEHGAALTALGNSFVDTTASLTLGAYHSFSTNSGDITNNLFDPQPSDLFAHPSLEADAQTTPGGAPDNRFTTKVRVLTDTITVQGITTGLGFNLYTSLSAPVPIIRNEELILLRAEANLQSGNLAAALDDINFIRVNSGGLAPITPPAWNGMNAGQRIDELLYNRRYSLLWEGGFSWIDARRYDRLGDLPLDLPSHNIMPRFPFPVSECDARSGQPAAACQPQAGI